MHVVAAGSAFDVPLPDWDFRAIDATLRRGAAMVVFGVQAVGFAAAMWAMTAVVCVL